MIGGDPRPLLPENLGQTDRVGTKSPIFDLQQENCHTVGKVLSRTVLSASLPDLSCLLLSLQCFLSVVLFLRRINMNERMSS